MGRILQTGRPRTSYLDPGLAVTRTGAPLHSAKSKNRIEGVRPIFFAISGFESEITTIIAAVDHVADRTGKFNAELTGHDLKDDSGETWTVYVQLRQ